METKQEPKLSASLFIQKDACLGIIWNGLGWKEFLQGKLQREQREALTELWIIWSGLTARSIRVRRRFVVSKLLKNDEGCRLDLPIPPGWKEFLRMLQERQLAVFKTSQDIWSGVTARYIRARRQLAAESVPQAG